MAIKRGGHPSDRLREGRYRRAGWGLALFQKRIEERAGCVVGVAGRRDMDVC